MSTGLNRKHLALTAADICITRIKRLFAELRARTLFFHFESFLIVFSILLFTASSLNLLPISNLRSIPGVNPHLATSSDHRFIDVEAFTTGPGYFSVGGPQFSNGDLEECTQGRGNSRISGGNQLFDIPSKPGLFPCALGSQGTGARTRRAATRSMDASDPSTASSMVGLLSCSPDFEDGDGAFVPSPGDDIDDDEVTATDNPSVQERGNKRGASTVELSDSSESEKPPKKRAAPKGRGRVKKGKNTADSDSDLPKSRKKSPKKKTKGKQVAEEDPENQSLLDALHDTQRHIQADSNLSG
ncbi:hypothetical protein B0H11DRAFT_1934490 [Mycena galericulata]|nr:hypothetical protein B0H11DRAFT_1934490 [Mycena galericulata]